MRSTRARKPSKRSLQKLEADNDEEETKQQHTTSNMPRKRRKIVKSDSKKPTRRQSYQSPELLELLGSDDDDNDEPMNDSEGASVGTTPAPSATPPRGKRRPQSQAASPAANKKKKTGVAKKGGSSKNARQSRKRPNQSNISDNNTNAAAAAARTTTPARAAAAPPKKKIRLNGRKSNATLHRRKSEAHLQVLVPTPPDSSASESEAPPTPPPVRGRGRRAVGRGGGRNGYRPSIEPPQLPSRPPTGPPTTSPVAPIDEPSENDSEERDSLPQSPIPPPSLSPPRDILRPSSEGSRSERSRGRRVRGGRESDGSRSRGREIYPGSHNRIENRRPASNRPRPTQNPSRRSPQRRSPQRVSPTNPRPHVYNIPDDSSSSPSLSPLPPIRRSPRRRNLPHNVVPPHLHPPPPMQPPMQHQPTISAFARFRMGFFAYFWRWASPVLWLTLLIALLAAITYDNNGGFNLMGYVFQPSDFFNTTPNVVFCDSIDMTISRRRGVVGAVDNCEMCPHEAICKDGKAMCSHGKHLNPTTLACEFDETEAAKLLVSIERYAFEILTHRNGLFQCSNYTTMRKYGDPSMNSQSDSITLYDNLLATLGEPSHHIHDSSHPWMKSEDLQKFIAVKLDRKKNAPIFQAQFDRFVRKLREYHYSIKPTDYVLTTKDWPYSELQINNIRPWMRSLKSNQSLGCQLYYQFMKHVILWTFGAIFLLFAVRVYAMRTINAKCKAMANDLKAEVFQHLREAKERSLTGESAQYLARDAIRDQLFEGISEDTDGGIYLSTIVYITLRSVCRCRFDLERAIRSDVNLRCRVWAFLQDRIHHDSNIVVLQHIVDGTSQPVWQLSSSMIL